jgi:hypothetical protein
MNQFGGALMGKIRIVAATEFDRAAGRHLESVLRGHTTIIRRYKRKIAALIPMKDYELLAGYKEKLKTKREQKLLGTSKRISRPPLVKKTQVPISRPPRVKETGEPISRPRRSEKKFNSRITSPIASKKTI